MRVRRSDRYIEELYPNVWLMDNHKWAFYAWESHRVRPGNEIPSVLVHVDYHWDGVNDFQEPETVTHLINLHSCENIKELVAEDILVRYDSFIAPAIIRGFIREIHFFVWITKTISVWIKVCCMNIGLHNLFTRISIPLLNMSLEDF